MSIELKDKVVVITGGCRGFGYELSKLFSENSARVYVCDKVCDINNSNVTAFTCDVTNESEVSEFFKKVISTAGGIDILVNNAGVWLPHMNMEDILLVDAERILDVNVIGTFLCTKHAVKYMKENKSGAIVNIISTSALGPRPTTSIYSASKYAVNGFTKAVREEVVEYGIKVYSVFPGAMKTDIFKSGVPSDYVEYMDAKGVAERVIENFKKDIPEEELVINKL